MNYNSWDRNVRHPPRGPRGGGNRGFRGGWRGRNRGWHNNHYQQHHPPTPSGRGTWGNFPRPEYNNYGEIQIAPFNPHQIFNDSHMTSFGSRTRFPLPAQKLKPKPPSRSTSPLPGTEEYTQSKIQQTSEFIKRQLNLDSSKNNVQNNIENSDTCKISNRDNTPIYNLCDTNNFKNSADHDKVILISDNTTTNTVQRKVSRHQNRNLKTSKNIDVREICDKIIDHISHLNYSKKMNLVNQPGSSGYDFAIQQIQKQKRLELSRALRDMSNKHTQDATDSEVINSIIPDIGIKIEDLPREVIAELSTTLNCDLDNIQSEPINPELFFKQAQELCDTFDSANDDFNSISEFSFRTDTLQNEIQNEPSNPTGILDIPFSSEQAEDNILSNEASVLNMSPTVSAPSPTYSENEDFVIPSDFINPSKDDFTCPLKDFTDPSSEGYLDPAKPNLSKSSKGDRGNLTKITFRNYPKKVSSNLSKDNLLNPSEEEFVNTADDEFIEPSSVSFIHNANDTYFEIPTENFIQERPISPLTDIQSNFISEPTEPSMDYFIDSVEEIIYSPKDELNSPSNEFINPTKDDFINPSNDDCDKASHDNLVSPSSDNFLNQPNYDEDILDSTKEDLINPLNNEYINTAKNDCMASSKEDFINPSNDDCENISDDFVSSSKDDFISRSDDDFIDLPDYEASKDAFINPSKEDIIEESPLNLINPSRDDFINTLEDNSIDSFKNKSTKPSTNDFINPSKDDFDNPIEDKFINHRKSSLKEKFINPPKDDFNIPIEGNCINTESCSKENFINPSKDVFINPSKDDFINPSKDDFINPSKDDFINPLNDLINQSKNDYINPSKEIYINPSKEIYINPSKEIYINPSKEDFINSTKDMFINPSKDDFINPSKEDFINPSYDMMIIPSTGDTKIPLRDGSKRSLKVKSLNKLSNDLPVDSASSSYNKLNPETISSSHNVLPISGKELVDNFDENSCGYDESSVNPENPNFTPICIPRDSVIGAEFRPDRKSNSKSLLTQEPDLTVPLQLNHGDSSTKKKLVLKRPATLSLDKKTQNHIQIDEPVLLDIKEEFPEHASVSSHSYISNLSDHFGKLKNQTTQFFRNDKCSFSRDLLPHNTHLPNYNASYKTSNEPSHSSHRKTKKSIFHHEDKQTAVALDVQQNIFSESPLSPNKNMRPLKERLRLLTEVKATRKQTRKLKIGKLPERDNNVNSNEPTIHNSDLSRTDRNLPDSISNIMKDTIELEISIEPKRKMWKSPGEKKLMCDSLFNISGSSAYVPEEEILDYELSDSSVKLPESNADEVPKDLDNISLSEEADSIIECGVNLLSVAAVDDPNSSLNTIAQQSERYDETMKALIDNTSPTLFTGIENEQIDDIDQDNTQTNILNMDIFQDSEIPTQEENNMVIDTEIDSCVNEKQICSKNSELYRNNKQEQKNFALTGKNNETDDTNSDVIKISRENVDAVQERIQQLHTAPSKTEHSDSKLDKIVEQNESHNHSVDKPSNISNSSKNIKRNDNVHTKMDKDKCIVLEKESSSSEKKERTQDKKDYKNNEKAKSSSDQRKSENRRHDSKSRHRSKSSEKSKVEVPIKSGSTKELQKEKSKSKSNSKEDKSKEDIPKNASEHLQHKTVDGNVKKDRSKSRESNYKIQESKDNAGKGKKHESELSSKSKERDKNVKTEDKSKHKDRSKEKIKDKSNKPSDLKDTKVSNEDRNKNDKRRTTSAERKTGAERKVITPSQEKPKSGSLEKSKKFVETNTQTKVIHKVSIETQTSDKLKFKHPQKSSSTQTEREVLNDSSVQTENIQKKDVESQTDILISDNLNLGNNFNTPKVGLLQERINNESFFNFASHNNSEHLKRIVTRLQSINKHILALQNEQQVLCTEILDLFSKNNDTVSLTTDNESTKNTLKSPLEALQTPSIITELANSSVDVPNSDVLQAEATTTEVLSKNSEESGEPAVLQVEATTSELVTDKSVDELVISQAETTSAEITKCSSGLSVLSVTFQAETTTSEVSDNSLLKNEHLIFQAEATTTEVIKENSEFVHAKRRKGRTRRRTDLIDIDENNLGSNSKTRRLRSREIEEEPVKKLQKNNITSEAIYEQSESKESEVNDQVVTSSSISIKIPINTIEYQNAAPKESPGPKSKRSRKKSRNRKIHEDKLHSEDNKNSTNIEECVEAVAFRDNIIRPTLESEPTDVQQCSVETSVISNVLDDVKVTQRKTRRKFKSASQSNVQGVIDQVVRQSEVENNENTSAQNDIPISEPMKIKLRKSKISETTETQSDGGIAPVISPLDKILNENDTKTTRKRRKSECGGSSIGHEENENPESKRIKPDCQALAKDNENVPIEHKESNNINSIDQVQSSCTENSPLLSYIMSPMPTLKEMTVHVTRMDITPYLPPLIYTDGEHSEDVDEHLEYNEKNYSYAKVSNWLQNNNEVNNHPLNEEPLKVVAPDVPNENAPVKELVDNENLNVEKEVENVVPDNISMEVDKVQTSNIEPVNIVTEDVKTEDAEFKITYEGFQGVILVVKVIDETLLAASDEGNIYCYYWKTGQLNSTIKVASKAVTSICVLEQPVLSIFFGSLDGRISFFNFETKEIFKTIKLNDAIHCIEHSWGFLFCGSYRGSIIRYDLKKELEHSHKISEQSVLMLKATQEGARKILLVASRNCPVTVRDAMSGLLLRIISTPSTVYTLLLQKSILYFGTSQHDILVYTFHDGQQLCVYKASKGVVCMQIVGNLMFAACYDGNIYVFNVKTNDSLGVISGPGGLLLSMQIVSDHIIVGSKNSHLICIKIPEEYLKQR